MTQTHILNYRNGRVYRGGHPGLHARVYLILTVTLLSLCSCHSAQNTTGQIKRTNQLDQKLFQYNVNDVEEISLAKMDPETGENWMTTLHRVEKPRQRKSSQAKWEFTSLPDGISLRDRKANSTFIMHLLDSFTTLRKVMDAPIGPLGSFGLDPPHWMVRIRTQRDSLEVRIGDSLTVEKGLYLTWDQKQILVASGSALKLLSMIPNFKYLRDSSWTSFSLDDVDEFQLSSHSKPYFYAQRDGAQWTDRSHQPIRFSARSSLRKIAWQDSDDLIKSFTEMKPHQVLDDPSLVQKVRRLPPTQFSFEVKLINRHGDQESLRMIPQASKKILGWSSARPETLFVLNSKMIQDLKNSEPNLRQSH
jgi:hypothetical protein